MKIMNNNLKSIFNQSFKEANENFEQYESLKDFLLSELSIYSLDEQVPWLEKVSKGGLSSGEAISCFASYSPLSMFLACPDSVQDDIDKFELHCLSKESEGLEELIEKMVIR